MFPGHRALGFAAAGAIFWDVLVCVGESDRVDPAVPDDWLLRRWSAGRPLSASESAVHADDGGGIFDRDHPLDFATDSELVADLLCELLYQHFLWVAGFGAVAVCD